MEWYFKKLFEDVYGMFCGILLEVISIERNFDSRYFWVIWEDRRFYGKR